MAYPVKEAKELVKYIMRLDDASEYMDADIRRDGYRFTLHFEKGENVGGLKKEEYTKLAEGAATVKALMKLSEEYNVEMPISKLVYDVIYNDVKPMDAMAALFERDVKTEFSKEY